MAYTEFTDKVKILIKAGDGGDGMNSFKAYSADDSGRTQQYREQAERAVFSIFREVLWLYLNYDS